MNTRTDVSTQGAATDSNQAGRGRTLAVFAVTLGLAQLAFLSWADTHLQTSTKNGIALAAFLCYSGLVVALAWRSGQRAYWTAWALLGVYTATGDMATGTVPQGLASWAKVLPMNLLQALVWGLSGRAIIAVADRCAVDEPSFREWQRLSLQALAALAATVLGLVGIWLVAVAFLNGADRFVMFAAPLTRFMAFFWMYAHLNLLLMLAVLGAYHAWRLRERVRVRELEAAHLTSRLAEAQNQALRMQIQPHFLFNTLHSISALIHSEPAAADRMISRLADLLRMTLDLGNRQEITLRQEVGYIENYLAIEAIRFEERLRVDFAIQPDCLEARVPAFLLQPLVENAVKHGFSDQCLTCALEVRATRIEEWLELVVEDDGVGYEGGGRQGTGTTNTEARLRLLYKDRYRFTLTGVAGKGTIACIRIPWMNPQA
jgi:signal transduction histidine kinase